jgi:hypothetical protein
MTWAKGGCCRPPSVEQMAATLGRWFGLGDSQLLELLPNLAQWNPSQRNLRFV